MNSASQIDFEHNPACERAHNPGCKCRCRGAGHQVDLLYRALSCSSAQDLQEFERDLERALGGLHARFDQVSVPARKGRRIPRASEISRANYSRGWGATWFETLVVDDFLKVALLSTAQASLQSTAGARTRQNKLAADITTGAMGIIPTTTGTTIADGHLWCSIVAEAAASQVGRSGLGSPAPRYSLLCLPRHSRTLEPVAYSSTRATGLRHIRQAIAASSLSPTHKSQVLALTGAAVCADMWRHPAVVRECALSFARLSPPSQALSQASVGTSGNLAALADRWREQGHWH